MQEGYVRENKCHQSDHEKGADQSQSRHTGFYRKKAIIGNSL